MKATSTEIDQLITSLKTCVQQPDSVDPSFIRDDSVAYNDLCFEVNRRLAHVGGLIDRGLRDDAIEVSQRDDDLLTLFEKLDFLERSAWVVLVQSLGLQAPPGLDYESATKLNSAHAMLGDLEGLLRNHRLLALARAPLRNRIAVLNSLVQRDGGNPIWQTDAALLQRARLEQLPGEIRSAVQAGDRVALESLESELTRSTWWIDKPASLLAGVRGAVADFGRRDALRQIEQAGRQLQDAFAAFDVAAGFAAADSVRHWMPIAEVSDDHAAVEPLQPALDWSDEQRAAMAREQRAAGLIDRLQHALDENADAATLAGALVAVESLGERAPAILVTRGRERIASFDLVRRRRVGLALASAAIVLACVTGLLVWRTIEGRRAAEIANWESTFSDLLRQERWDDADTFLTSLRSDVAERPVFVQGRQSIDAARKSEADRAAAFANLLAEIKASPPDQPAYALLNRLKDLAQTPDERNEVAIQQALADEIQMSARQAKFSRLSARLEALQRRVDELLSSDFIGRERLDRITALRGEVDAFVAETKPSQADLSSAAAQLARLLAADETRLRDSAARDSALQSVTQAVGDVDRFIDEARRFAGKYKEDPMADSLRQMDADGTGLRSMQAWLSVTGHPAFAQSKRVDAEQAMRWLDELDAAIEIAPDHPLAARAVPQRSAYEAITRRAEAIKSLRKLFAWKMLQPMYVYTRKSSGEKFYSSRPALGDVGVDKKVPFFVDTAFLTNTENFGARYETEVRPFVYKAGHSEFAEAARPIVESISEADFTVKGFEILKELESQPLTEIDPIFKLFLMRELLKRLTPASEPIRAGFGPLLQEWEATQFDWQANWLTPGNADGRIAETRRIAAKLLPDADTWKACDTRMRASYNQFHADRGVVPEWVGWLANIDGRWTILIKKKGLRGRLVMPPIDAATSATFVTVAELNGEISLSVTPSRAFVAGRPVYLLASTPASPTNPVANR